MTISLGYQIPNFSYPGGPQTLFDTVAAQAREAEASGFDTVLVMDHFYQLPGIGTPDQPMMEAYSTLAALAASTSTIKLSALVTGNTYRNPAMLAKTVSTLDVISHGRAAAAARHGSAADVRHAVVRGRHALHRHSHGYRGVGLIGVASAW